MTEWMSAEKNNHVSAKRQLLLVVAMDAELPATRLPDVSGWQITLLYTGIGKINAAWKLARHLAQTADHDMPDLIVNFGTAGAVTTGLPALIEVDVAVQRDMDVRGLGIALGETPFEPETAQIRLTNKEATQQAMGDIKPIICGSGDDFAQTVPELACDVVDMELYAIARIALDHGIMTRSLKFISDHVDEDSASDWRAALQVAADHLVAALPDYLQTWSGELGKK